MEETVRYLFHARFFVVIANAVVNNPALLFVFSSALWKKALDILFVLDQDEPKRKGKRPRGGNSAFLAPIKLSDALVKFLGTGESALPRSDVVKRIWDYIKLNNLQVLCDYDLNQ